MKTPSKNRWKWVLLAYKPSNEACMPRFFRVIQVDTRDKNTPYASWASIGVFDTKAEADAMRKIMEAT